MINGWIKIHRQILEWEWYSDMNVRVLFLHLILKANHKPKRHKGVLIEAGCLVTSRDLLSLETGLTSRQIRGALDKLKMTNEVSIKTSTQGTYIQLVKYKDYQLVPSDLPSKRPTSARQMPTNKKERKKEEKEERDFSDEKRVPELLFNSVENSSAIDQLDRKSYWNRLLSIWKTSENEYALKNVSKSIETEHLKEIVLYVESLGSDVKHLENVWISSLVKQKCFTVGQIQKEISRKRTVHKPALNHLHVTAIDPNNKDQWKGVDIQEINIGNPNEL
jgi:hypothetical protein